MFDYSEMRESLQRGNAPRVRLLAEQALTSGCSAIEILNEGLIASMAIVGEKFKRNEVYVPEVMVAARAMNAGLDVIKPVLIATGAPSVGKLVIGTVKGDLHDIGKNLVKMMLVGAGFEVIDLGTDVPDVKIVEAVREHRPNIVALSALLTTTMAAQGDVINALKEAGLRESVKIMVGGAPVTQSFCDSIGADAYTSDAASCAEVARTFV